MNNPYMTSVYRQSIAITTDSSGAFSTTIATMSGRFVQYTYEPAAANALDANWDLDVVSEKGTVLINQDNLAATAVTKAIGQIVYDNTGAAAIYATDNEVHIPGIWVANETITVTVAQGGNAQSGTLHLYFTPA